MRALRGFILTTALGTQISWAGIAGAQTVEPAPDTPAAPPPAAPAAPPTASTPPAEQPKPAPRKLDKAALEEAKRAYAAGEAAYQAGDFKAAVQSFSSAQAIVPSPHAAYWLGLSLKGAGQVPEAIAELKTLLASAASERIGPEKLATAKATLDELNKTAGQVELSTDPAGASVSVDGDVRPGVSPLAVELAPGTHTLTISLPGYQSMELELDVPPGSKGAQKLSLTKLPPAPAPVAGQAAAAPSDSHRVVLKPTGAVIEKPSNVGMYAVFGLAGAAVVTGTVFGVMALGNKSDFDKKPSNTAADDQERNSMIADISFGAAITLGLAGIVMATTANESTGTEKPQVAKSHTRFSLTPYAGTRGGGAHASWQF